MKDRYQMNRMKISFLLALGIFFVVFLAGCGAEKKQETAAPMAEQTVESVPLSKRDFGKFKDAKILVAYYSRADENTGVGIVEKGNTEIIAERIAEDLGADIYKVEPEKPYPKTYKEATEVAKQEKADNARPAVKGERPDISRYDIVFLGYPIWWGDLPMTMYTFLEGEDFRGKVIIPFCTHEGSGLGSTGDTIMKIVQPRAVLPGLEMRGTKAQQEQDAAKTEVDNWLESLGADDRL